MLKLGTLLAYLGNCEDKKIAFGSWHLKSYIFITLFLRFGVVVAAFLSPRGPSITRINTARSCVLVQGAKKEIQKFHTFLLWILVPVITDAYHREFNVVSMPSSQVVYYLVFIRNEVRFP